MFIHGPLNIHGIYYVYTKGIKVLFFCISGSFNEVNPCHALRQSNVEDKTFNTAQFSVKNKQRDFTVYT